MVRKDRLPFWPVSSRALTPKREVRKLSGSFEKGVVSLIYPNARAGMTHEYNGYYGEDQDGFSLLFDSEGLEVPRAGFGYVGFFLFEIKKVVELFGFALDLAEWSRDGDSRNLASSWPPRSISLLHC
jgi:hypothetical protein